MERVLLVLLVVLVLSRQEERHTRTLLFLFCLPRESRAMPILCVSVLL